MAAVLFPATFFLARFFPILGSAFARTCFPRGGTVHERLDVQGKTPRGLGGGGCVHLLLFVALDRLGGARQPAAACRQVIRQIKAITELSEDNTALTRAMDVNGDNDGGGITPASDFLGEIFCRTQDHLADMPLGFEPMLQYGFVGTTPDRSIQQLGAVGCFAIPVKPGAIDRPHKMFPNFEDGLI